jgi:ABC-2 type transport system ATP-binding protein
MMAMKHVVAVANLEKRYGAVRALGGVSLDVESATVFGLLGQNGAGKTTLVKILLGMVAPTSGTADLLGSPVGSVAARRAVGYLPEDHRLPEYHTGPSLLDVYGGLQGLPRRQRRQRAAELLDMLGLAGRERLPIRGYSKGMKQRLGLAQALLHRPSVLFLDEPTDGVDPVGRKQIRDLLLAERSRGVTIFINSHLLGEIEQLCDRVAILKQGQVVLAGAVAELVGGKATWLVEFEASGTPAGSQGPIDEHQSPPPVSRWESGWLEPTGMGGMQRLHLASDAAGALDGFLDEARGRGLRLRHLERERESLEKIYLQLADQGGPST